MKQLPLNLLVFTSAGGHFKHFDVYKTSIRHLESSLGSLDVFQNRFAHIKVRHTIEELNRVDEMKAFFHSKGINTIVTVGDWERGMSHQNEYLKDIARMANIREMHLAPYTLWFEDDSPIFVKKGMLYPYLASAITNLETDFESLNVRFIREGVQQKTTPYTDGFVGVETFDFQPNISRTRDLMVASKIIFANWNHFKNIQCEMAFRLAMDFLSNSPRRFLGFNSEDVTSHHIGTPEYPQYVERFQNEQLI